MQLGEMEPVHREAWKYLLREATRLREARRDSPIGCAALSELLRRPVSAYFDKPGAEKYVPLDSAKIAEPSATASSKHASI